MAEGLKYDASKRSWHDAMSAAAPGGDIQRSAISTLIRSIPVAVMITDREMRVLAASPRWMRDLNLTEADFAERTIYELAPNHFPKFKPFYDRCLAGETFKTPRLRWVHPDGRIEWLRTELTPWRDAEGEIAGMISVAVDITDMVEALARVERSQERLQMAVELADLHVWEVDLTNGQVETAGARETFFDEDVDIVAFAADTNVTIHPEDRAAIGDKWRDAVLADQPFRPEYRINRKDDKEVWAACTVKLVRDEAGEPHRLVGAMQNITARKEADRALLRAKEDAETANRAKSEFLAAMSHEIRTPLNGVLGMAQAMAADALSPVQRERLETIRQSGETLLVVLNDLLDLSKIEAGKLELEDTEFELTALAESVRASFAPLAAGKSLALELDIAGGAEGTYRGDPTRLRQILFNLVSNALKFTEAGEVRVDIRRQVDELEISVSDTGIGIPAERLSRLFNKFEQADASTTRRFGGTGLGLAICRDLARLMGGEIRAESLEGEGSRFTLKLALPRVGEEIRDHADGAPNAPPTVAVREIRVLAAEDNPVNQMVLRTLLEQAGIAPVIVNNGVEALEAWRDGPWDAIFMDVQMPLMDGPTCARLIREAETQSGAARTPIIALTANAMSHQAAEYLESGMDGVVSKPIKVECLYAALESVLNGEA